MSLLFDHGIPSPFNIRCNDLTVDGMISGGGVEGIFTPVLQFGGASVGITYASQVGAYQRNGNIVTFSLTMNLTSKGSSTGQASIAGLPIPSVFKNNTGNQAPVITFVNLTYTSGQPIYAFISGSSISSIGQSTVGGANTQLSDTAFANNTSLSISGFYFSG